MEDNDKTKLLFTRQAAWLGFLAYILLIFIVVLVFLLG